MANELVFKISTDSQGNDVHLTNMPIEAADAFIVFLESLSKIAKLYPNENDIKISIREGSAEGVLEYPETVDVISTELIDVIEGRSQNAEYTKLLKDVQDKIMANGLGYEVSYKTNNVSRDLTQEFKAKKFVLKRGRRLEWNERVEFIKGKLFEAGGKTKSNIHLDVDGKDIRVECTQQQAIRLNKLLYSTIHLCVLRKWKTIDEPSYLLMDSYATEQTYLLFKNFYQAFQEDTSLERFDNIYGRVIEAVEKPKIKAEVIKIMRLFDHAQADRGVIRTILVALKPLRQDEPIAFMYKGLADVLRSGSTHNVI